LHNRRLMRNIIILLIVGVVSAAALPAEAQHNVPEGGTFAVAAAISPTTTDSAFLDNGLGFSGSVEGHLAPFLSLRAQVGTAWWNIDGLSFDGSVRPLTGLANVVVGWTAGDWRPYVTGGGGWYRYNYTEAGVDGENTKTGWDAGAGVEFFFAPEATLTLETLFHRVPNVTTTRAALGYKGSYWAFAFGAKKYF
jgi:opacity protein-like surface antigen